MQGVASTRRKGTSPQHQKQKQNKEVILPKEETKEFSIQQEEVERLIRIERRRLLG